MQSAEEFKDSLVRIDGGCSCDFDVEALALICARDREIVELCREAAKEATLWKEHPCIDAALDSVLRDLGLMDM